MGGDGRPRLGASVSAAVFARAIAAATAAAALARGLHAETVEAAGWRLRVWRGGRPGGEPWLLLHGLGATSATWLPTIGALRDDCELVVPELSANGGSRGPRAAIGVAEGVEVVAELARRVFPESRPTVAGVSLGGWIALKLAVAHPEIPARILAVVPGGYRHQDWRRIESMVRVQTLADIGAMWKALFVEPPWFLRLGRYGLYLLYRTPTVRDVLATVREADAFDDEDLARIAVPVGLVWGENDTLFRVEGGQAMRRALPDATLTVIPLAGHGVQWERPHEFLAAIAAFRAATSLPPAAGAVEDRPAAEGACAGAAGGSPCTHPTT
jgi:pimeloyl-ACP methyl ester carboxylesterase